MKIYQQPKVEIEKYNLGNLMVTTESEGINDNPEANNIKFDESETINIPEDVNNNLWDD